MFRVLIPMKISSVGIDFLQDNNCEIISCPTDEGSIIEAVKECDAILTRTEKITDKVINAGNRLKVVSKHGVGVDNIDLVAAKQAGVYVTNAPLSNTVSVAEHTMALILATAKNVVSGCIAQRAGDHAFRNRQEGIDLFAKKLAVIGLGRIGQSVAKMAHYGFGMRVCGYDKFADVNAIESFITVENSMEEAIATADFVSLHIPATSENVKIFNAQLLTKMKPGSIIINSARGEVLCEKSLLAVINSGHLRGAGLDVFEIEPPDANNPLFECENIVVSPHNAALTLEAKERMALHAAMGICEVLEGKTPKWAVIVPDNPRK